MKRIMAVYDADPFYADRFAEFVNQKEAVFHAVAFTSLARLRAFSEQQRIEMLLVGDEVEEEALEGIRAEQLIRLGETEFPGKEAKTVYKYQATDSVLREVMSCYQVKEQPVRMVTGSQKSRIIGVYSPVGRCGKTAFAFTLGQDLSRSSKTLFLTLEECCALSAFTGTEYEAGLSELLYYYRQGEYSHLRLRGVTYSWGELDYVPPAEYPEDLAQMKGEELAGLIDLIASEGLYETIVVDLGHFFWGTELFLSLCDVVYTPVQEDPVSLVKLEQWQKYIEVSGYGGLLERIRRIRLPYQKNLVQQGHYLEQLLWGEMGDFVRSLTGRGDSGKEEA